MTETTDESSTSPAEGPFGAPAEIPTRVLVLGMVRHDGTLEASDLYPVARACGQTDEQLRSCLRRLVTEGLFEREGEGREARFRATPAGMRELSLPIERTRLAFTQDAAGKGWDRNWRLVAFAVPEARRTARDAFRDRLLEVGGAAIHNGLYVSPHSWIDPVREFARTLDLLEHVTFATTDDLEIGGETDPRRIAAQLWPIDDLAARYRRFVDAHREVPEKLEQRRSASRRLSEAEFLPGSLAFNIEFQGCFNDDPLLPPELLPRPWPGREARELVLTCRRLSMLLREEHDRPKLFAPFDEMLLSIRS